MIDRTTYDKEHAPRVGKLVFCGVTRYWYDPDVPPRNDFTDNSEYSARLKAIWEEMLSSTPARSEEEYIHCDDIRRVTRVRGQEPCTRLDVYKNGSPDTVDITGTTDDEHVSLLLTIKEAHAE